MMIMMLVLSVCDSQCLHRLHFSVYCFTDLCVPSMTNILPYHLVAYFPNFLIRLFWNIYTCIVLTAILEWICLSINTWKWFLRVECLFWQSKVHSFDKSGGYGWFVVRYISLSRLTVRLTCVYLCSGWQFHYVFWTSAKWAKWAWLACWLWLVVQGS